VAEWLKDIAYHHIDLKVAVSNPGGDIFLTIITLNYSIKITQANLANRHLVVESTNGS